MNKKIYFFNFVFFLVISLNVYIFIPLFHSLAFSTIIAGAFYPLFKYLRRKYKLSKKWSALVVSFCILLTVILPSIYFIVQISKESLEVYQNIRQDFGKDIIKSHFIGDGYIGKGLDIFLQVTGKEMNKEQIYNQLVEKLQTYTGHILKLINRLIGDVFSFIFNFILMMIAIYALFLSGENLKKYIFKLSPLPSEQEQRILDRYNQMNYVTLVANGVGGIIQGIAAGIAFWIADVPSVFLWTTVMIILAFIPLIGMSIVFIPVSIYLSFKGNTMEGVLLFLWCGLVSLFVENFFKPKFVGDRLQINGILLLFYTIAGMSVFGAAGIFYGPILCIIFLTFGEIFNSYYKNLNKL